MPSHCEADAVFFFTFLKNFFEQKKHISILVLEKTQRIVLWITGQGKQVGDEQSIFETASFWTELSTSVFQDYSSRQLNLELLMCFHALDCTLTVFSVSQIWQQLHPRIRCQCQLFVQTQITLSLGRLFSLLNTMISQYLTGWSKILISACQLRLFDFSCFWFCLPRTLTFYFWF